MAKKIILDTDIGTFLDDPLALLYCLKSPELKLEGVCVVNGDIDYRKKLVENILRDGGLSLPVYSDGASEYLAERLNEDLEILAIGPLTNISGALKRKSPTRKNIHLMAGLVCDPSKEDLLRLDCEYNIINDIEAARRVISSNNVRTLLPGNLNKNGVIDKRTLKDFLETDQITRAVKKYIPGLSRNYSHPIEIGDVLAAVSLDHPEIFRYEPMKLSLNDDGVLLVDEEGSEIDVVMSVDYKKFKEIFYDTISRK